MYELLNRNFNYITIFKLIVIILIGIYVFSEPIPYFLASDANTYGVSTKLLAEGNFAYTNELLMNTGIGKFVPSGWIKTIDNYAIPQSYGLNYFGVLFYVIFGEYGLIYFNPAVTILFLITSERIATKIFNKHVGLLTLLFLSTNHLVLKTALNYQTENLSALFFLIGTFFLINFVKNKNDKYILLSSIFFVLSVFIRTAGILVLPFELVLIPVIFLINFRLNSLNSFTHMIKKFKKQIVKKFFLMTIPWIVFLLLWFNINLSYFGDPLTNYRMVNQEFDERLHRDSNFNSFVKIESKHFSVFNQFAGYLLPYQINAIFQDSENNFEEQFGKSWISIFSFLIFLLAILVSIKNKNKEMVVFILIILTIPIIWFYASVTTEERAELGVPGRYVIASSTISYIIFSFLIYSFYNTNVKIKKIVRIFIMFMLLGFFIMAFYHIQPIQKIINNDFEFVNTSIYSEGIPIDRTGLNEKSVIAARNTNWVVDHGYIPFTLPMKEKLTQDNVNVLRNIIEDGYKIYTYKASTYPLENQTTRLLVDEYNFVLKEFSESFCSLNINENMEISDDVCFTFEHKPEFIPKTIEKYGY